MITPMSPQFLVGHRSVEGEPAPRRLRGAAEREDGTVGFDHAVIQKTHYPDCRQLTRSISPLLASNVNQAGSPSGGHARNFVMPDADTTGPTLSSAGIGAAGPGFVMLAFARSASLRTVSAQRDGPPGSAAGSVQPTQSSPQSPARALRPAPRTLRQSPAPSCARVVLGPPRGRSPAARGWRMSAAAGWGRRRVRTPG